MKSALKEALKRIRRIGTFWIAEQSMSYLESIRIYELDLVAELLPANGRLLEIGAGTGWQAKALASRGYDVCAVDLPSSNYSHDRIWDVIDYDGKTLPYADQSFDIVFSSNVLEHIPHIREFQSEIQRVIRPGGCAIHVLPSSSWRLWTNLTHVLRFWTIPNVHGEHAGNALSEVSFFSRQWWTRLFLATGWTVVTQRTNGLFYTGNAILGPRLSMSTRRKLSRIFGSSCNIFVLKPAGRLPES